MVRSGAKFTPIEKIAWCATKSSSDPFIIFSGGTNVDNDTKVCRKCCLWGPGIKKYDFFLIESQGQTVNREKVIANEMTFWDFVFFFPQEFFSFFFHTFWVRGVPAAGRM